MWDKSHRGTNALDGGAPYYDSYETSDGKWVAVGAVESRILGCVCGAPRHRRTGSPRPDEPEHVAGAPSTDRRCHRATDPGRMGRTRRRNGNRASRRSSPRSKSPAIRTIGSVPAMSWWVTRCSHLPHPWLTARCADRPHPTPDAGRRTALGILADWGFGTDRDRTLRAEPGPTPASPEHVDQVLMRPAVRRACAP